MARSKKHLYPIADQKLSEAAKAVFHPARLKILRFLHARGTHCVKDIAKGHPLSKEGLSEHLNQLYTHHLVTYHEYFPFSFYTIHEENVREALQQLMTFCSEFLDLQSPASSDKPTTAP